MSFSKEMQKALEADGQKLRDLTGEDHGPIFIEDREIWDTCEECGGEGVWEEPRPQHDDPYFAVVKMCSCCGGSGWTAK